jgi:hypothetical protein
MGRFSENAPPEKTKTRSIEARKLCLLRNTAVRPLDGGGDSKY